MASTPSVYVGPWLNHEGSWWEYVQWTVTNNGSTSIKLAVGIAFGIAAVPLSDILYRLGDWARYWRKEPPRVKGGENGLPIVGSRETDALLSRSTSASPYPRDGGRQSRKQTRGWKSLVFAVLVWITIFVLWAILGNQAPDVQGNSMALASSTVCGPYSLKGDASLDETIADDMLQGEKEAAAGEYARDCYGQAPMIGLDRCNYFNHRTIPYSQEKVKCPFVNTTRCRQTYNAVQFTTGLVDSNVIGLHSNSRPKFRRSTTCVPLSISNDFKKGPYWHGTQLQVDYCWGPMNRTIDNKEDFTRYTFRQYGNPFQWGIAAYSLNVYQATPYPDIDSWEPLPGLISDDGSYLSILFIASCRIMYMGPSNDLIFPATQKFKETEYFYNDEPISRPLACIDTSEVCSSDGNCSRIDQEHRVHNKEYEYVRAALRKSTTYQSIKSRLGNGLRATESIRDTVSYELSDDQWIIESEQLFQTSLARIQFDAHDIAIGFGHDKASYQSDSLQWIDAETLCHLYKFQLPKGYDNINVLLYLGLFVSTSLVWLLGRKTPFAYNERKQEWLQGGSMMAFEAGVLILKCSFTRDKSDLTLARERGKMLNQANNSLSPRTSAPNPTSTPGRPQQQTDGIVQALASSMSIPQPDTPATITRASPASSVDVTQLTLSPQMPKPIPTNPPSNTTHNGLTLQTQPATPRTATSARSSRSNSRTSQTASIGGL